MRPTAFVIVAAASLLGSAAQATVLDFNTVNATGTTCIGSGASPCYGDRVTTTSDAFGSYTAGNGFTPNVTVSYQNSFAGGAVNPGMAVWAGGSTGQVLGLASPATTGFMTLTADPGFQVKLNGFDVGVFGPQTTIFQILDGGPAGSVLQTIPFDSSVATSVLIGLTASELTIAWTNWNVGLATVNFDQVAGGVVPLPATLPLFAGGLGMIGLAMRGRKRKQAAA